MSRKYMIQLPEKYFTIFQFVIGILKKLGTLIKNCYI